MVEVLKIDDFAEIKIVPVEGKKEMHYLVIEPILTEPERRALVELKKFLTEKIEYDYETVLKEKDPREYLEKKMNEVIKESFRVANKRSVEKLKYFVFRDFLGLGKIDAIMKDPKIEDIYCNGVNIPIFVRHKKYGSLRTNLAFTDLAELEKFVMIISQKCKRFVTYAEPLLDATLPDGSRVQATFGQDVTLKGPTFSIRKFQKLPITPIELIEFGTVNPAIMAYFWLAIENNVSILLAGGSGTGKTSFLNAICMFIPPDYKIISIEDTSELNLPHKNWVKAITRAGYGPSSESGQRYGEVTMFDLLKASLRQRPDYVLVGEVRGAEASVLFQGMASGHPSIGTIHAESLEAVIERLTTPPINLPANLIELIDVVVMQILATSKGPNARRVSKVIEIKDVTHGKPDVRTPFLWDSYTDKFIPVESFLDDNKNWQTESFLIEKLSLQTGKPIEELTKELRTRERILRWMMKNNVKNFFDVVEIIANYWYSPESVLEKISKEPAKTERHESVKTERIENEKHEPATSEHITHRIKHALKLRIRRHKRGKK
jgi:flagellar protein FlaI